MSVVHKKQLTLLEFRRVLFDVHDQRPDIGVRFRLIGEMWMQEFTRVSFVTEKGVLLASGNANKLIFIPSLRNVMQMEFDQNFQNFEAYFHYDVVLTEEH